jgi:transcription initiation factor IIE alpha subunit
MKESASLERVEAAADAFGNERLRWLIGKGDILMQKGELTEKRLKQLIEITVTEEIDRSQILRELIDGPATISELSKATNMESSHILENLIALMKWNLVEIVGTENREYIYAKKTV